MVLTLNTLILPLPTRPRRRHRHFILHKHGLSSLTLHGIGLFEMPPPPPPLYRRHSKHYITPFPHFPSLPSHLFITADMTNPTHPFNLPLPPHTHSTRDIHTRGPSSTFPITSTSLGWALRSRPIIRVQQDTTQGKKEGKGNNEAATRGSEGKRLRGGMMLGTWVEEES